MERYIGLDVHAKSCTMVVLSQSGKLLRERVVETNGAALIEAIRMEPGHKHVCLEEGTQSAWLYEILSPRVHETVVLQERRSRGPKSDSKDARELAEKLRTGAVDCRVFKAPRQFTRLRMLARVHQMVVRDFVRTQSRVKSMYRGRGIQTSSRSVYGDTEREAWLAKLPASSRTAMTRLYEQLDFLVELREQAENDLVTEVHKHRIARVLQTCPGMGPIRVARLLPVVVTPHRFRTKQQFWSYCGLAIVTCSSADWVQAPDGSWMRAKVAQTRGLNRRRNGVLVEERGGVRPGQVPQKAHRTPVLVANRGDSADLRPTAVRWDTSFEGEDPIGCWSTATPKTRDISYPPSECPKKPWPQKAQMETWFPHLRGERRGCKGTTRSAGPQGPEHTGSQLLGSERRHPQTPDVRTTDEQDRSSLTSSPYGNVRSRQFGRGQLRPTAP